VTPPFQIKYFLEKKTLKQNKENKNKDLVMENLHG